MQEYRPKGLIYVFTFNQLLGCDAVAPLLYFLLGSATSAFA